jgi:predicted ATP-binding protein involved in virulence
MSPMRLESAEIQRFRNFTDAQQMTVEPDVTGLIGKNESGKTTVLKALHRLNPANNPDKFALTVEYPRRRLARDRRAEELELVAPVTATFALDESDAAVLTSLLGVTPPASTRVIASRTYYSSRRS